LKLHIESIEDRVDELERENEEMANVIEIMDHIENKCKDLNEKV